MNRRENQETPEAPAAPSNKENGSAQPAAARPKKRGRQPAPASDGSVYLLLEKTGKYRQISESDLLVEAGRMLKEPSVRLVKGQLLVPQITLRPGEIEHGCFRVHSSPPLDSAVPETINSASRV